MAIWIDENVYKQECNETLLYEYLYHLSHMLAVQNRYFTKYQYYDEFSLFCASRLFIRLRNRQELTPIKSVLNYLKRIIYPYKVDFEQETYLHNEKDVEVIYNDFDLGAALLDEVNLFSSMEFSMTLSSVIMIVKDHLKKIPYKRNSSEWYNIYTSCLLTLLNSITISNFDKQRLCEKKRNISQVTDRYYTELRYSKPLLYHLDDSYSNYIYVLVNELRHVIASQLSFECRTYNSSESSFKSLLYNSLQKEN